MNQYCQKATLISNFLKNTTFKIENTREDESHMSTIVVKEKKLCEDADKVTLHMLLSLKKEADTFYHFSCVLS